MATEPAKTSSTDAKTVGGLEIPRLQDNMPLGEMLSTIIRGIGDAQMQLNRASVEALKELATTTIPFSLSNTDSTQLSLIQLGFSPPFLHVQEATVEISIELKYSASRTTDLKAGGTISVGSKDTKQAAPESAAKEGEAATPAAAPAKADMFDKIMSNVAIAGNVSYSDARKHSLDISAVSKVTAKIVSTPPPTQLATLIDVMVERQRANIKSAVAAATEAKS